MTPENRKNPATGKIEKYWKICYREEGKQRRESLGFMSEKEAKVLLRKWEAHRELGLASAPPPAAPISAAKLLPTLREWWGDTVDEKWSPSRMLDWFDARGLAASTREGANAARRAIIRDLGSHHLDEVTPAMGDAFVAGLKRRGLKSRTCQIYMDWLRRSFAIAVADKVLAAAPALNRPRDTDRRASKWYTPEQTAMLLAELERRVGARIIGRDAALAIRMQECMVMRPGEVLSRRWSDINRDRQWKKATLAIRAADLPDGTQWEPKLRKERTVPLPARVLAALRDHWLLQGQPVDGWIFPREGDDRWPVGSFKKALASACEAIGLPVLNPHALRHTGATRIALSGTERRTLMQIGGWSGGEMLDELYEHTSDARMADVMASSEVAPEAGPVEPAAAAKQGRGKRA